METVHGIKWAGQPDIQFKCDDSWSTPAWADKDNPSEPNTLVPSVYRADNGYLYSFETNLVTCSQCKVKFQKEKERTKRRGHIATEEDLKYEAILDNWAANPKEVYSWYYLLDGSGRVDIDRHGAFPWNTSYTYNSVKEAAMSVIDRKV